MRIELAPITPSLSITSYLGSFFPDTFSLVFSLACTCCAFILYAHFSSSSVSFIPPFTAPFFGILIFLTSASQTAALNVCPQLILYPIILFTVDAAQPWPTTFFFSQLFVSQCFLEYHVKRTTMLRVPCHYLIFLIICI